MATNTHHRIKATPFPFDVLFKLEGFKLLLFLQTLSPGEMGYRRQ